MTSEQIALQLFTVREFLKDVESARKALFKIREIGYKAVEVYSMGAFSDEQTKQMINDAGLEIISALCDPMTILNDPEKIVQQAKLFGCKYISYPWPEKIELTSKEVVLDLAKKLDHSGGVLKKQGVTLSYHNHNIEFVRFDGELMLDLIYENTNSQNLQAELDTYWVQNGGGNPVKWIKKLSGRLPLLHVKDYCIIDKAPFFAPVGQGNLCFSEIIEAADDSGVQWFVVEQDRCTGDIFDSIEYSYNYLSRELAN